MVAGVAQLVERDLAKVEVAGSSPVTRLFYVFHNPSCSFMFCYLSICYPILTAFLIVRKTLFLHQKRVKKRVKTRFWYFFTRFCKEVSY